MGSIKHNYSKMWLQVTQSRPVIIALNLLNRIYYGLGITIPARAEVKEGK